MRLKIEVSLHYLIKSTFKFCIVLVLVFNYNSICSQDTIIIKGSIKDSLGYVIPFANVFITETENNSIIAFGSTDKDGIFEIYFKKDSAQYYIHANFLGYSKQKILFSPDQKSGYEFNFILYPKNLELEEVLIIGKTPKVIEKGDTIQFKVSNYSDSTEYNVEDLLRKIPGININDQGGISVNGKAIEKLLIEGDDLSGSNYTIISKNLNANVIDQVHIIDNYQENAVLNKIVISDDIAINLILKENAKNSIGGSLTFGGGYGDELKRFGHINLFSFSKKNKSLLLSNSNNVGFSSYGDVDNVLELNSTTYKNLGLTEQYTNDFIKIRDINLIGLPSPFTNNSKDNIIAVSNFNRLNNNIKIRTSGTIYDKNVTQESGNYTNYFFDGQDFSVLENKSFYKKDKIYNLEIDNDYISNSKNFKIRNLTILNYKNIYTESQIERTVNDYFNAVPVEMNRKPLQFYSGLEVTKKINSRSFAQGVIDYSYTSSKESIDAFSNQYSEFFNVKDFNYLSQKLNTSSTSINPFLRYFFAKDAFEFLLDFGYNYSKIKIDKINELQSESSDHVLLIENSFSNTSFITANSSYLISKLSIRKRFFEYQAGFKVQKQFIQNFSELNFPILQINDVLINPFLNINYEKNNYTKLNFFYQYIEELPSPNSFYLGKIFLDYQTIALGYNEFLKNNRHTISLNHSYNNPINLTYIRHGISLNYSNRSIGSVINFNRNLFETAFVYPVSKGNLSIYSNWDKYIDKIKSRIKFGLQYAVNQSNLILDGKDANAFNQIGSINLFYGTAFDKFINFYLQSEAQYSYGSVEQIAEKINFDNFTFKNTLSIKLDFITNLKIEPSIYIVNNFSSSHNNSLIASDFKGTYLFSKNTKIKSIQLEVVNLTNTQAYESFYSYEFSQTSNYIRAVPFFICIRVNTSI